MERLSLYGGTGFIGSHFASLYPNDVSIVPRADYVDTHNDSGHALYMISTTDNYNIHTYPTLDIETNLIRLVKTLQHAEFKTINFISSWFVYGTPKFYTGVTENDPCDPQGFYSITKYAAEKMLISWCMTHGIKYRILRLGNVIGPGDKKVSAKKNALTYLIHQLAENKPIQLYHGGDFVRDYIHVNDACRAIRMVIEKSEPNQIYNIGGGIPYRFGSLINYAKSSLNSTSEITSIMPSPFHQVVQTKDFWLNTSKLEALGFQCALTPHDAIDEIVSSLPVR